MKGIMLAAASTALLALSLLATPQARAQVSPVCKEAGMGGSKLALCSAYVRKSCPQPENHPEPQCAALRNAFFEVSGGENLDDVLSPDSTQAPIPSSGGTITLPGIGSTTFPAGAFPDGARVKLSVGSDATVAANFNEFASIFRPSSRLAYEVTVSTGPATFTSMT